MKKEKFEIGDLIIEHLCDSFYLIILDKINGNEAEGHIISDTDIIETQEEAEDYIPFDKPYYTDEADYPIDLDKCEVLIRNFNKG